MSELITPEDAVAQNARSLSTLVRAIALSPGRFSLILVRSNYMSLRERVLAQLKEQCAEIQELVLPESAKTLYIKIEAEVGDEQPGALMVLGLESVTAIDDLLTSANQVRDKFRQNFSFPLVLWVNDQVLQKLVKLARDFHSWAGAPIHLAIATDELSQLLRQEADLIFTKILAAGADQFVNNAALNLRMSAGKRFELESACQELQSCGRLELALAASQQFILGRDAYTNNQMERSRELYEQSLAFWQQSQDLERQACVLFHLGLWWRRYAVVHRAEHKTACEQARQYYQQCIDILQQANRPELVPQFINSLAEVLQQLKQWQQLEIVAKASVEWHQNHPNPFRLANAYGYLAEVTLAKSAWSETKQYAETALTTIAQLSSPDRIQNQDTDVDWIKHHQSWYRLLLAKAQQHLAQKPVAIQSLETAKAECKPEYHPLLYLRILEALRSLYFEQHHYLEAFEIKQHQRSIEQQYGFRAFIGAGRLQSERQVINSGLLPSRDEEAQLTAPVQQQASVALEIAASGRQHDVNRLIERISRDDHKLIVLYGQSGVGKSSIVQAGLVPALKQLAIGERDTLPILLQVYTDWVGELGKRLAEGLEEVRGVKMPMASPATDDSIVDLIAQFKRNADRNLLTVLIFDQFEEFFFVYKDQAKRRPFYAFLQSCLEIPYVKVILSLREDYLHYLLQCERVTDLRSIDCNILDKKILYYLGNFSPEDAKSVIRHLTERSQFHLESALIDELVKDLAGELGEVRPIELQVVGAQLQAEQITTLAEYQLRGPKEKLVERFLEEVVKDGGAENERAAQLVLYLLTDENNTRPLKTRTELAADLAAEADKIDLVLEILRKSGLVFLLPQFPADLYQLVHDYLVALIRQQQGAELLAELEEEREQRKRKEAELNRVLRRQLRVAIAAGAVMTGLAALTIGFWWQSEFQRQRAITALITSSEILFDSNKDFDALIASLTAGVQLKQVFGAEADGETRVVATLRQAVYEVQERNRLEGHSRGIWSVSFSPDGQTLASASDDRTIKLWSREGKLLYNLKGHSAELRSVSFSPDSHTLASASLDRTVKLWNNGGELLKTLTGHRAGVNSVSFSPDGQTLASASGDKTIKLWSRDGTLLKTLTEHRAGVNSVSFSPDGKLLASASDDKTIKLWSRDGTLLKTLTGHRAGVNSVSFSPDGQTLASASGDNTIKLWSRDGKPIKTLPGHGNEVRSVSFSPDGQTLASASADNTIKLWSRDGRLLNTLQGHSNHVTSVSFSPDGKTLASGSWDNTIKLWLWNNKRLNTLNGDAGFYSIRFSPDGKTLASGSWDSTIKLWSRDGKLIKTLRGHNYGVVSISFSPNGQMLASASWDNTIKLWSRDGKLIKTLAGHIDKVNSVSFSPDGQILASASWDNTIKLWSRDGKLLNTLNGDAGINSVSFSPDGQILASASWDNTIKLWSRDGKLLNTLKGHTAAVNSVSFNPDGKMLASASDDKTIKIWSRDGKLLHTLTGHSDKINSVSFSPDGKTIASASEDKTIKIWSRDGKLLNILKGYRTEVMSVSFSPDGQTLASASYDMTILWDLRHVENLDELVVYGCDWVHDYLKNNSNVSESDRHLCDGIGTQKQ